MPTYAYKCTDCGAALEVVQAFTDEALTVCPTCGGRLRKQYSAVGVSFNGSGFYRTDSRSSAQPAKAAPSASGEKAASSTTASTPDSPKSTPSASD